MQQKNKNLIFFGLAFVCMTHNAFAFLGKSFLTYRSQSDNMARLWAGWPFVSVTDEQARSKSDHVVYSFNVTPEYTHSFRAGKLADYFFGSSIVAVSGSQSGNRGATDILADYFGLPSDFRSTLKLCPVVQNFLVDFYWRADFGCLAEGLSLTIHAPLVYTKWNLNLKETVTSPGSNFYPAGYLSSTDISRAQLGPNATAFFAGQYTFGDVQLPLLFGKINCAQKKTRLADIQAFLQWDFINREDGRTGVVVFGGAPAGNRSESIFLFEPMVGNGKHWEFGAGLNGYFSWWESKCCDVMLGVFWQVLVSHLFKSDQVRSFDFTNNGPGSRYMLIEQMHSSVFELYTASGVRPPNQYAGILYTAINKTTLPCSISIPAQVDVLLKLDVRGGGFDGEIGYNLWFRTAESLKCRKALLGSFAVKGDAQLYGFQPATASDEPAALSVSQHLATLYKGQGVGNFVTGSQYQNENADSPVQAFSDNAAAHPLNQLTVADQNALGLPAEDINTSSSPVLLQDSDINNCSALSSKTISHKFFAHVGYAGQELCDCWIPYIGIGAEAEISCFCFTNNSAVSQWGVWFKGGVSY